MNLKAWFKATRNDPRRQLVIDETGRTHKYVSSVSRGERTGSPDLHKKLAAASLKHTPDLVMTLEKLRPDVWGSQAA